MPKTKPKVGSILVNKNGERFEVVSIENKLIMIKSLFTESED